MAYRTDHNKNVSNGKNETYSRSVIKSWDTILPLPTAVIPWSSSFIFVIACVCFLQSINGDFVFDDSEAVTNNIDIRPETPIRNIFKNDFWGTKLIRNTSHKSYRPFTVITFRINYLISGLHPCSFHFVNIVLHGIVSVLILKTMSVILREATGDNGASKSAFTCALLFAVHPIHTESVSAVVGRADLLCAIFFLLSFLSYVRSLNVLLNVQIFYLLFTLILAGTSMLCKEQGITIIGICCIYDLVIYSRLDFGQIFTHGTRKYNLRSPVTVVPTKKKLSLFISRQLVLAIGGIALLAMRWYVMGAAAPVFQQVDNPASFENSLIIRIINYHYIYAMNAWLLFYPFWLCFDWSMGCIPLIRSVYDGRLLAILIFWVTFILLVHCGISHPSKKTRRIVCMSLAFILIPFLPASNLFFRVGFVVAERALYLPSMGFCLLLVVGLRQITLLLDEHSYPIIQGSFYMLIIAFAARSIQRTYDWQNEETLFQSGLKVCPLNAKVHYNIAKNAADHGDREAAIERYTEAIRLNPMYDQAMNNLANILKDKGELIEAERLLISAIKIRTDFAAAWMNLGIVQSSLKKMTEAEKSYLMAIRCRRRYPDCYYNLGNLYLEQKHYDDAYRAWRNATTLQPTHLVAWNNMVIMLDSIGDLTKAEVVAREALRHLPSEASLHFNLANVLGKSSRYAESEKHFLSAIRQNENNPTYHTNLGVLYHRWKKYSLAEDAYKRALELNSNMKSAHENLQLLYRAVGRV